METRTDEFLDPCEDCKHGGVPNLSPDDNPIRRDGRACDVLTWAGVSHSSRDHPGNSSQPTDGAPSIPGAALSDSSGALVMDEPAATDTTTFFGIPAQPGGPLHGHSEHRVNPTAIQGEVPAGVGKQRTSRQNEITESVSTVTPWGENCSNNEKGSAAAL